MSRIDVIGAVRLRAPEAGASLTAVGPTLIMRADDRGSLGYFMRWVPSRARRRAVLDRVDATLRRCGLTLDVRIGERLAARLGARARPTLAGRLAGCPGLQLPWSGWLALARARLTRVAA